MIIVSTMNTFQYPFFFNLAEAENEDLCFKCKIGGHLLCCDGCVRAYHYECVEPPLNKRQLPVVWLGPCCNSKETGSKIAHTRDLETYSADNAGLQLHEMDRTNVTQIKTFEAIAREHSHQSPIISTDTAAIDEASEILLDQHINKPVRASGSATRFNENSTYPSETCSLAAQKAYRRSGPQAGLLLDRLAKSPTDSADHALEQGTRDSEYHEPASGKSTTAVDGKNYISNHSETREGATSSEVAVSGTTELEHGLPLGTHHQEVGGLEGIEASAELRMTDSVEEEEPPSVTTEEIIRLGHEVHLLRKSISAKKMSKEHFAQYEATLGKIAPHLAKDRESLSHLYRQMNGLCMEMARLKDSIARKESDVKQSELQQNHIQELKEAARQNISKFEKIVREKNVLLGLSNDD